MLLTDDLPYPRLYNAVDGVDEVQAERFGFLVLTPWSHPLAYWSTKLTLTRFEVDEVYLARTFPHHRHYPLTAQQIDGLLRGVPLHKQRKETADVADRPGDNPILESSVTGMPKNC